MRRVILETPYNGDNWKDIEENIRFARLCAHDCLIHDEAPFASHLLYTQEGILDDKIPEERMQGIEAGFAWKEVADKTAVYINRGISKGMRFGIRKTVLQGQPFEYRVLENYDRAIQSKIFTVTGASGAGKSTIVRKFLELNPSSGLITSFTTRAPRASDIPGEYQCSIPQEFFENKEKFLWTVNVHGNIYGTTKNSLFEALSSGKLHLMILISEVIPIMYDAVNSVSGSNTTITSFYLLSPEEKELRRRLSTREEEAFLVEQRINDCKKWDETALASDIPFIFFASNIGIEKTVQQMRIFS